MACKPGDRVGSQAYYKGHCFIAFYDPTGEEFLYAFDNIREILKFLGEPVNRKNINRVNVEICRRLKTETHHTRVLGGRLTSVWVYDTDDKEA